MNTYPLIIYFAPFSTCFNGYLLKFWSNRPEVVYKKGLLKISQKFTGKHLCWRFFLIKLQTLRPETLLKRNSNTSVFLRILRILTNTYFEEHLRTASCETYLIFIIFTETRKTILKASWLSFFLEFRIFNVTK